MLQAVVGDILRTNRFLVYSLVDQRRHNAFPESVRFIDPSNDIFQSIFQAAKIADWTLLIAPESESILENCLTRLDSFSQRVLSPDLPFVQLTSDKHRTSEFLAAKGIPSINGCCLSEMDNGKTPTFPVVVKPNDGAGCENSFLLKSRSEWEQIVPGLDQEKFLAQPFHSGIPVSVNILAGRTTTFLPATRQIFDPIGNSGRMGGYQRAEKITNAHLLARANGLARRTVDALPNTQGYFGIDMILGESEAAEPTDVVVEINPRLTSSYVFQRKWLSKNIAEVMLDNILVETPKPIS